MTKTKIAIKEIPDLYGMSPTHSIEVTHPDGKEALVICGNFSLEHVKRISACIQRTLDVH